MLDHGRSQGSAIDHAGIVMREHFHSEHCPAPWLTLVHGGRQVENLSPENVEHAVRQESRQ
jgi:hypothetical protein